ncbi:hypothetical protein BACCAP_03478 [Pseudoflavonifractor capillosus ATCC 29799]|uniref:Uncharacterized protein n=1 Tax=Pseudoflavonifractor capillosus ATCC 29799 TaxID=411467 RepID=A6NZ27_9FIRM|nr:hypothetical protein BACCAP_03478 [Pseudoflavonifractor capillosus ATCC 29799]
MLRRLSETAEHIFLPDPDREGERSVRFPQKGKGAEEAKMLLCLKGKKIAKTLRFPVFLCLTIRWTYAIISNCAGMSALSVSKRCF